MEFEKSLRKAEHLLNQDRFGEAQKEIRHYLSSNPQNIDALAILAQTHLGLGQVEQADGIIDDMLKLDASNAAILYMKGVTQARLGQDKNALKFLKSALSFNPYLPDAHAAISVIYFQQAKFEEALSSANAGLALDPQNETCLNQRSRALLKLGRVEEQLEADRQALKSNPLNPDTHATVGFTELEKGNTKKAKEHFREALKLDPNNDYARSGMVHAIKSTNPFYRLFLKYVFWMQGLSPQVRWAVVIIGYLLIQGLDRISESLGVFSPVAEVMITAYLIFAISTWIIGPVSNIFLRFHSFGKYLLDENDIRTANLSAILLTTSLVGVIVLFFGSQVEWYNIGIYLICCGVALTVVISSIENAVLEKSKRNLKLAGGIFGVACGILILSAFALPGLALKLFTWLIYAFIGYQFFANTQK